MAKKPNQPDSERESITPSELVSRVLRLRRYVPYPSDIGFAEGEYIPQPKIEITANEDSIRSKLNSISQFAQEISWVLRIISAILIIVAIVSVDQLVFNPEILRTLGLISGVLLLVSSFRFRVVAVAEPVTVNTSVSTAEMSVERQDEENDS
ncbi:hypothetical protein [Haloferax sp. ATB1]|uniref:hypothetical protein n=1 Tax=Haloferax sp. ATB1 TaxID=1508454 RepID=UPI000FE13CB3|nr:hypothetical protein [Haloferax sp. ATB1]